MPDVAFLAQVERGAVRLTDAGRAALTASQAA